MSHKRNIILAENDQQIIEYVSKFFSFLGEFNFQNVSTAMELLAGVNALEPELVIVDLNTTRVDSQQILGDIKKRHAAVKILAITARSRSGEEKLLKSQGAEEVIAKPIDFDDLSKKIKKLLSGDLLEEEPVYARLLIADDEIELSWFLKEIFERVGLEVHTAQDGDEAFHLFKEKGCNLIVLDLKMPKLGGLDLISLLEKSVDPAPPKAIFIMTAGLGETLSELHRQTYPVLDKPLDLEYFKDRILEACEKHGLALKKETGKSLKEPD